MVDVNRPISLFAARMARREPTEAERKLWAMLSDDSLGGLEFRRQVPIGPYTAQFLSHAPALVIEITNPHSGAQLQAHERKAYFQRHGFEVARYPASQVLAAPERVLADIAARAAGALAEAVAG